MASPTATRWFVSDHEFDRSIDDYAVVVPTSECMAADLREYGSYRRPQENFADLATTMNVSSTPFPVFYDGLLVYADVDDSNPAHKTWVYEARAKEPGLEEEDDEIEEAREQLKTFLKGKRKHGNYPETERNLDWQIDECQDMGELRWYMMEHLIQLADPGMRKATLRLLSGQELEAIPRPVFVLVGVVDTLQTTRPGELQGWKIAFDFVDQLFTVKSFHVTDFGNSLHQSWANPEGDNDGISRVGSANDFVELIKASSCAQDPWARVVLRIVGIWIYNNRAGFKAIPGNETLFSDEAMEELKKVLDGIKADLEKIEFPNQELEGDKFTAAQSFACSRLVGINFDEGQMRDLAVTAKEEGRDVLANNLVELHERVTGALKQIMEKPDEPLML